MLKNYLLIGWRNILRTKGYSLINITGLSIGMAVAILIGLWIWDEVNFDQSFKNYRRIGQVYHHVTFGGEPMTIPDIPYPIGQELKNSYPEVEEATVASWPRERLLSYNEKAISKTGMYVEPQYLDMFSVEMVEGTSNLATDLHSVIIAKSLADALIGDNPVGKMLRFEGRDLLTVAGVFRDFPSNSHLADVKIFTSMEYYFSLSDETRRQRDSWEAYAFQSFVLLKDGASFEKLGGRIETLLYGKSSNDGKALNPKGMVFPMAEWHLYADFNDGVSTGSRARIVWLFGVIGIFVLMLACINFMNLSTARSEKRAKEVGVRKVMGSIRRQLVFQFMSESLVIVTTGFLLSLLIAYLALPWFNSVADKTMSIPWSDPVFILGSLSFISVTGLIAGSYPALYLSSFSPVRVLRGALKAGRFSVIPRKAMVIFQFTTSIVLIIGTVVVFLQIRHAKERPVGFDREGIFHVSIRTDALAKADYNSLRNELIATGVVENMATSDFPITGNMSGDASLTWEGKDPTTQPLVAMNACSHDFPGTNGFQFVQGRDFSRDFTTDSSAVLVNEMAAKLLPGSDPIGKKIKFGYGKERTIVGVIKDQIRWSPFAKQSPHMYYVSYDAKGFITVRLRNTAPTQDALRKVEAVIRKFDAGAPFEYEFLADDYAHSFNTEEQIGKLASVFAVLAIFISCIGIFGLAAFAASQRTKEIGIRKVLGASVFDVWRLLSRDFVVLVLCSIVLGAPLAYYLSGRWLEQYEYRVNISWMIFAVTGMFALLLTLFTVSYQALKAAWANPVNSLRSE